MKKIIIWVVIGLVLIILIALIANRSSQQNNNVSIKVGAIVFLTGAQASLGEEVRNALLLAQDMKNPISDKKIEFVIEDSQDEPKLALGAYNKLKQQNIPVIISTGDQVSYALSPVANKDNVLLLMTVAAATETSGDNTFRAFITADKQANIMADYSSKVLGNKKVAVLYINNIYGQSYLDTYKNALNKNGADVVASEAFGIADNELKAQITKIIANNPDTVTIVGFGPAYIVAFNQLRQFGWSKSILTDNTLSIPYFFNSVAPENLRDIYFTSTNFDTQNPTNPSMAEFIQEYKKRFKTAPSFVGAYTFDLVDALFYAIQGCDYNSESIKNCLLKIKDKQGVLGSIDFSSREMRVPLYIKKVENGKVVTQQEIK